MGLGLFFFAKKAVFFDIINIMSSILTYPLDKISLHAIIEMYG